jgi:hypothetical protein
MAGKSNQSDHMYYQFDSDKYPPCKERKRCNTCCLISIICSVGILITCIAALLCFGGVFLGIVWPRDVSMEVITIERESIQIELNPLPVIGLSFKTTIKSTNHCFVNVDLKKIRVFILYRNETIGVVSRNDPISLLRGTTQNFTMDLQLKNTGLSYTQMVLHMLSDIRSTGKISIRFDGFAEVNYLAFSVTPTFQSTKEFAPMNTTLTGFIHRFLRI